MNTQIMKEKATRALGKAELKLKKNSPQILLTVGIGGILTATVLSCRATLKAQDVIDKHNEALDSAHKAKQMVEDEELPPEAYTEEDYKKDIVNIYVKTGAELAKLYGPSIVVGGLSIFAICKSNGILNERNGILAMTAAAEAKEFKDYRARVAERFGEDVEEEIMYGVKDVEVTREEMDPKTGETKTVNETVKEVTNLDKFSFFFDASCNSYVGSGDLWTKDAHLNLITLQMAAEHFNSITRSKGYLFYNDIRSYFNLPPIPEGQLYGVMYDPDTSDWMIDFGIFDSADDLNRRFVNGIEPVALLRFDNLKLIYEEI